MIKTIGLSAVIYILLITVLVRVSRDEEKKRRHYVPVKMLCSGAFLLFMALSFFINGPAEKDRYILLFAFIFCFLGDLFMGFYNLKRRKRFMICGIITFMLSHIFFIAFNYAFSGSTVNVFLDIALAAFGPVILYILLRRFHLHFGKLLFPALIYSFFVTLFMVKCLENSKITPLIGIAGVLFLLSDLSLIFLYFYYFKEKRHEKNVHVFNLLTYYASIFLIYSVAILFT